MSFSKLQLDMLEENQFCIFISKKKNLMYWSTGKEE